MDVSVATETAVIQVAVSTQVEKPAEPEPQPVVKPSAAAVAAPQQSGFDAKFVQNLVNAQVRFFSLDIIGAMCNVRRLQRFCFIADTKAVTDAACLLTLSNHHRYSVSGLDGMLIIIILTIHVRLYI